MSGLEARPEVSVLIPAFQAAAFIDRTLYLARGQSYANIRILVSVDQGDDDTVARVQRHVKADARVSAFEHRARLGWVGNVNFLLDNVRTPLFFIYFHDDVILPQYVEMLLDALREHPAAASAHCDMEHFGADRPASPGRPMSGTTTHRLLDFMLAPQRSSPLRSLIRRDRGGQLRLPDTGRHGLWANEVFLLELFAAGPAVHVPETLYARWNQRPGGLTDGWKSLPDDEARAGWQSVIGHAIRLFDKVAETRAERDALVFGLYLQFYPRLLSKRAMQPPLFRDAGELHPRFAELSMPVDLAGYGTDIRQWAEQRWRRCVAAAVPAGAVTC